ncbi:hypothetical protein M9458_050601 [Cirrhinus mrigala]|uniref:Uncharacterized protein n=1 Tax=Cirrhinus mrigala TaxID=683832 RepID=A0ABD0MVZ2_CIRMR
MTIKQEVTREAAEGAVTVSPWERLLALKSTTVQECGRTEAKQGVGLDHGAVTDSEALEDLDRGSVADSGTLEDLGRGALEQKSTMFDFEEPGTMAEQGAMAGHTGQTEQTGAKTPTVESITSIAEQRVHG